MKKSRMLLLAMAAMSLTACAQSEYRSYDNLYPDVNTGSCVAQFDEVIDEVSTVKNVLVRNKEVVNYYHDNVVVENHYNMNGRAVGYARYIPRRPVSHATSNRVVIPRRVTSSYAHTKTYEKHKYICLEGSDDDKWFFFFRLNSDYLTNREELGHLIDYARTNPYSSFYIDAYADAETGGYEANMRISQMRANAIISVLLREGISKNRLFVQHHGSVKQPYRTNNLNRCVTVSTSSK